MSVWGRRVQVGLALMSFSQIVPVAPKFRAPALFEGWEVFKAHTGKKRRSWGGWGVVLNVGYTCCVL